MSNEQKPESRQNRDFVQLYRPFFDSISDLGIKSPATLKLFLFLLKNMDNTNALCVSYKALQELLDMSKPTLVKAIGTLKDEGFICVLKSGSSNVYIVNPDIAWTSYDGQKQYCKFTSNVIVTPSENHEFLKNRNATTKFKHIDSDFIEAIQQKKNDFEKQCQEIHQDYDKPFDEETGEIFEENLEEEPYYA